MASVAPWLFSYDISWQFQQGRVCSCGREGKKSLFTELQLVSLRNPQFVYLAFSYLPAITSITTRAKWLSRMQYESLLEGNAEPEIFLNKKAEGVHYPTACPSHCLQSSAWALYLFSTKNVTWYYKTWGKMLHWLLTGILQAFISPSSSKEFAWKLWNVHWHSKTVPSPKALCTGQGG